MTASSKTSPYSRFIPREEIDAVAQWTFSNIDSNLAELRMADAAPEPQTLQEQDQAALERAWADGYAQGRDAGIQEVQQTMAAAFRKTSEDSAVRMGELLHNMSDQLLASEQKLARQLLELACDIARQVVRQELQVNTRQLRTVIGEALEMMVDDGMPTTVRMHPDDLALMRDALLDTLGENAPEFLPDTTLTPGGCIVQSASMAVDATVEKRWARAVGNLGLSVDWSVPEASDA